MTSLKKKGLRLLPCISLFGLFGAVLGAFVFLYVPTYLSSPASRPEHADIIRVLGGDDSRMIQALVLYKQGFANKMVLPCHLDRAANPGGCYSNKYVRAFLSSGAGRQDIYFDDLSSNTWEEGINALSLMKEHGWRHVLVVSDPPHMRRVDWVWSRITKNTSFHYTLVATSPEWWRPAHWWKNRRAVNMISSECIKLVYYWFMH